MSIIFLDVDGVLNRRHTLGDDLNYSFEPICLELLKELIEQMDANFVITSSVRFDPLNHQVLLCKLKEYGLDQRMVGYTPSINGNKSQEIKAYITNMDNVEPYVVLDDEWLSVPHQVKTDPVIGLSLEDVEWAIWLLKRQKKNLQHKL